MSANIAIAEGFLAAIDRDLYAMLRDEKRLAEVIETVEPAIGEGFHIRFVGPPESGFEQRFEGIEGLVAGWTEWTEPYARYDYETVSIESVGENVLTTGRQWPYPAGARAPIQMLPIASAWFFEDDLLTGIEFHLDSEHARERAQTGP